MEDFILLILVIFLGVLTNSTFGFGFNIVSMSLLTLYFELPLIAPLIPLLALTTNLWIVIRSRREIKYKSIAVLILAASVAVPIGIWISTYSAQDPIYNCWVRTTIGSLIIGIALFNLLIPVVPHFKGNKAAPFFGFLSGLMGGSFNITGPPIVIYGLFKRWDPQVFRATLQAFFVYVNSLIIIGHLYAGNLSNPQLRQFYFAALPVILIGTPIGKYINSRFEDPKRFRKYVYYIMLVLGTVMILKAFDYL
ncbi:MAG: sulfite exporter TauE/SafE family protein [Aureispira sp.]